MTNKLFYGDNLDVLREQIAAVEDTWHWNDRAEDALDQVMRSACLADLMG